MKIYLKGRNGVYDATAEYEDGKITVLKGSKIQMDFAEHIRGGRLAKKFRENNEYVDGNGVVIKDCEFNSASTAAQFVSGRSTNGLVAWKVEKKTSLKDYLETK